MRRFVFGPGVAAPVVQYTSHDAAALPLASGGGVTHAHAVHIAAGGEIGPHPAGFDQLFLVVQGAGWVSAGDGLRLPLVAGEGAFIATGELHAKGSETGMTAVMLQATHWTLQAPAPRLP